MGTTQSYLSQFFEENSASLQKNYPGLKLSRLLDEFCEFESVKPEDYFPGYQSLFFESIEQGIPLEYIQKSSYFYRSKFYVDERVLIPRSETEILVEDSLSWLNRQEGTYLKIAEIGIGSFALGLSILMDSQKRLDFWGGDISDEALEVARINLFRKQNLLNPSHAIELVNSDRLAKAAGTFDFIVSNPPYIKEKADRDGVHHQADGFEPHLALYLKDELFDQWFLDLFKSVSSQLVENGAFFMEGHEDSLDALKEMALNYFSEVELKNDYTGRVRFLHGFK